MIDSVHSFLSRQPWASRREVGSWFIVSLMIAAIMLVGVAITASILPSFPNRNSLLLQANPSWDDVTRIFTRNLAVLGIHLGACLVGAIVARPHTPLPGRLARLSFLHRPLPSWAGRVSLIYALVVTLFSVALQTTAIGFMLADVAAGVGRSPTWFVLMILPHALPELTAIFLPLGLFLLRARNAEHGSLRVWAWQSALIALPLLLAAAAFETWVTPHILRYWLGV